MLATDLVQKRINPKRKLRRGKSWGELSVGKKHNRKTDVVSISLKPKMRAEAKRLADKYDISLTQLIRILLRDAIVSQKSLVLHLDEELTDEQPTT